MEWLRTFGLWIKARLQWLGLLEQDAVPQDVTPEYETTASGFRYRLLPLESSDGYAAAMAQLREGEHLYRIHYDALRDGRGYPSLIGSEVSFRQACQRWSDWKLAAGIPVQRPVPVE